MKLSKDPRNIALKKAVKKYSRVKLKDPNFSSAEVKVTNIRFYNHLNIELDIEFKGGFWANSNFRGRILVDKKSRQNYSTIKTNRYLRKMVLPYLRSRMYYFGINLSHYSSIRKILWV